MKNVCNFNHGGCDKCVETARNNHTVGCMNHAERRGLHQLVPIRAPENILGAELNEVGAAVEFELS